MRARSTTSSSTGAFSSISKVFRKGPPDEDADLQVAKGELGKLEEKWAGAASAVVVVGKSRKGTICPNTIRSCLEAHARLVAFAVAEADTGAKMVSLATAERNQDLSLALRKVGRAMETLAGFEQSQVSPSDCNPCDCSPIADLVNLIGSE